MNVCKLCAKNWHSFKVMRATYCDVIWHFRKFSEFNRDFYFIGKKNWRLIPQVTYCTVVRTPYRNFRLPDVIRKRFHLRMALRRWVDNINLKFMQKSCRYYSHRIISRLNQFDGMTIEIRRMQIYCRYWFKQISILISKFEMTVENCKDIQAST